MCESTYNFTCSSLHMKHVLNPKDATFQVTPKSEFGRMLILQDNFQKTPFFMFHIIPRENAEKRVSRISAYLYIYQFLAI